MRNPLNPAVVGIKPSGIRKFFDIVHDMKDAISLGVGEPDFATPYHIREEGIYSLEKARTHYTGNAGLPELRKEITNFLNRRYGLSYDPMKETIVTVGGSEAIDLAFRTLVEKGDEVIIPQPAFVCYNPLCVMAGGIPVNINTKNEDNFRLKASDLEAAITPKTKLLVLPFPNNPTGAILERQDLEEIAEVVRRHDLMVLSDEIYCELTYGGRNHVSIASIDGMYERTVVINGFSKSYAMTGWRLGYALGPAPIISQMTKLHQYGIMSAPTTAQYAAIEALRNGDRDVNHMRDEYDMRRRLVVDSFNEMGLACFEPLGAFYVFPCIKSTGLSSEEFCTRLIMEKHVAVVPGNAFGKCGEGFVRVSYSYSLKHLKVALQRIREFLEELQHDN